MSTTKKVKDTGNIVWLSLDEIKEPDYVLRTMKYLQVIDAI